MRLAVLSDVHANREALLAVQEKLDELKPDCLCYLGDAVGYNPDPQFCLDRLTAAAAVVVPLDAGWSDVGSWSALQDALPRDAKPPAYGAGLDVLYVSP